MKTGGIKRFEICRKSVALPGKYRFAKWRKYAALAAAGVLTLMPENCRSGKQYCCRNTDFHDIEKQGKSGKT